MGIILIFLAALALCSLFGFFPRRGMGLYLVKAGGFLAGDTLSFIPLLYLLVLGMLMLFKQRRLHLTVAGAGLIIVLLVVFSGYDLAVRAPIWQDVLTREGGGVLGGSIALLASQAFTNLGAWLFLTAAFLVGFLLLTGKPLVSLLAVSRLRRIKGITLNERQDSEPPYDGRPKAHDMLARAIFQQSQTGLERKLDPPFPKEQETAAPPSTIIPPIQMRLSLPTQGYLLPGIDLLNPPRTLKTSRTGQDQRRQLEETLANFGVQARVVEVHRGPVITRYDVQPAVGVKVSRIVSLADDLALALAARGLRIEAPIPGKAALGIEVPNKEAIVVTIREVIESKEFQSSGVLSFVLGLDIAGETVIGDLTRMPHLLVAGATGSGKSVCLNTIIMSILYKAGPDRIKMIMIDPKMVELTAYDGIPHLIAPVVTDAKRAPSALKWAVTEMERRYKLMMEAGCRDIEAFNHGQNEPEALLPYIVVIIDELADLMMIARVEVEDLICRLAQMARATGMHLIIATQRPSVDVITGLIKANIPSRIAFAVPSVTDSRTILDSGGAERLLGRGDMLYSLAGVLKPRRVQGALVRADEVNKVVNFWKAQSVPAVKAVPVFKEEVHREGKEAFAHDDLFWDAVKVVLDFKQASASVLQRRLRVGYARAARLIDLMEDRGFVGPFEGSKPRELRVTAEQLAAIKEREF